MQIWIDELSKMMREISAGMGGENHNGEAINGHALHTRFTRTRARFYVRTPGIEVRLLAPGPAFFERELEHLVAGVGAHHLKALLHKRDRIYTETTF